MQNQLHVVENAAITSGGQGLAALRYAQSIAQAGCAVTFLSRQIQPIKQNQSGAENNIVLKMVPVCPNLTADLFVQYRFIKKLCKQKKFDLIHLHGVWSPLLAITALVAHKNEIPFVISPHGCLTPWALSYKRLKKWFALKIYQHRILASASLFVVSAGQELDDIRRLGLRQHVAVIPNGVDLDYRHLHNKNNKTIKTILFLSRVHPKKGLLDLVEAWAAIRRDGWRVLIAGGDEMGHRAEVEAAVKAHGLESDFEFAGFVEGADKQACFDIADIFILPTYSENFGIAVAEALANEIPVITTTGAPWQDLEKYRCGWWIDPGVSGVAAALTEAMSVDSIILREMGQRGRKLVEEKYSWDHIGVTALNASRWLLDRSMPKPTVIA